MIGVVVPCYNVAGHIDKVIGTMPDFVDYIICIDDCSEDDTQVKIRRNMEKEDRVVLLVNEKNQGVGGAISRGYEWAKEHNIEVTAVMAGDGQMNPAELNNIVKPVIEGKADYVKGNRFYKPEVLKKMPVIRLIGNIILSFLTKIVSGYWHVADTQCGFTAVSLKVLQTIDIKNIYKRYGMPNDFLVTLNIHDFSVKDVPVSSVYGIGEKSGIKISKVIFTISFLLFRLFFKRMMFKYVYKSFHPLVLLYFFGVPALCLGLTGGIVVLGIDIIDMFHLVFSIGYGWMLLYVLLIVSGFFSVVIAMFMDMEYNKDLFIR